MQYGFIKVAAAVPTVKVADCEYNTSQIKALMKQAEELGVEIVVFPELCITGYTCQDLFGQQTLLENAEHALRELLYYSEDFNVISIVGMPVVVCDQLLNCAVVFQQGKLLGVVPKTYLPNYREFYERRWFASAQDIENQLIDLAGEKIEIYSDPQIFVTDDGVRFGIEICEDVWAPTPPSNRLAVAGADLIFNLSASDELIGKHAYLKSLLAQQSARTMAGYIYSGCGFGESTQDLVYGGNALIYENGQLLQEGERFAMQNQLVTEQIDVEKLRAERRNNSTFVNACRNLKYAMRTEHFDITMIKCNDLIDPKEFQLTRSYDPLPFIPRAEDMAASCEEILSIQTMGLVKRLSHIGCRKVVVGISGGLDSTLALLVCVRCFDKLGADRRGIIGITMPGFGTTGRTHSNAVGLMEHLGVSSLEIPIGKSVMQHFEDIGQDANVHDMTYENCQARERTQILMDYANKVGGIVIGTGDLSELALGWATYNGDHISMYGVNASVPKTLVKHLVRYFAEHDADAETASILLDILDTPVSPELIPADEQGNIKQKTEDLVGPYELHDFFLYYAFRFGFRPRKIFLLARKAFAEEQYSDEVIKHWLKTFFRRFFAQQFKRSCLPDGPKVGSVTLSPRGDWRMPSDASSAQWLKECDEI